MASQLTLRPGRYSLLPMYPMVPSNHTETFYNALYQNASDELKVEMSDKLDLNNDRTCHDIWTSDNLGLSQSCGYPFIKLYSQYLQLIGTPIYNCPGCEGTNYRSAIIANKKKLMKTSMKDNDFKIPSGLEELLFDRSMKPLTIAVNSFDSFSGWLMLLSKISTIITTKKVQNQNQNQTFDSYFNKVIITGSHSKSIQLVEKGLADLASIDCVTFHQHQLYHNSKDSTQENGDEVEVIDWTLPAPALPFVTSVNMSKEHVSDLKLTIKHTISVDVSCQEAKEAMLLQDIDIVNTNRETYQEAINMHLELAAMVLPSVEDLLYQSSIPSSLIGGVQVECIS